MCNLVSAPLSLISPLLPYSLFPSLSLCRLPSSSSSPLAPLPPLLPLFFEASLLLLPRPSSYQFPSHTAQFISHPKNAEKDFIRIGDYELEICRSTPWYDEFREAFLQVQWPVDTEFLRHFLACVFVVSSFVDDPMANFDKLTNEQLQMQSLMPPKAYPKWFVPISPISTI